MLEALEGGKYRITAAFIAEMIEWFKADKTLPRRIAWEIILGAHEHFKNENTLESIDIQKGMTCDVIGDTHGLFAISFDFLRGLMLYLTGQLYDLLRLYSLTGEPSDTHCLLMNGDLVDRGSWSVEVILIAFAYKCELSKIFIVLSP
jgi:serine/threonine-protein phosphatase 5